jgi:hypothetical protein
MVHRGYVEYWVDSFNLLLLEIWIRKRRRIDNEQEVANVLHLLSKCILKKQENGSYHNSQLSSKDLFN